MIVGASINIDDLVYPLPSALFREDTNFILVDAIEVGIMKILKRIAIYNYFEALHRRYHKKICYKLKAINATIEQL